MFLQILSCHNLPLRLKLQRPRDLISILNLRQVVRGRESLRFISCHHVIPSVLKFVKPIFEFRKALVEWRPCLGCWRILQSFRKWFLFLLLLNLMSLSVIIERLLELFGDKLVLISLQHSFQFSFFHIFIISVNWWVHFLVWFQFPGFWLSLIVFRIQSSLFKIVFGVVYRCPVVWIYTRLVLRDDGWVLKLIVLISRIQGVFGPNSSSFNSFGSK